MSAEKVSIYLAKKASIASVDLSEKWRQLDVLYTKKLWHPLTIETKRLVYDPSFTSVENLKEFYDNFIHDFEHRINSLELVEIALAVAREIAKTDNAAACDFIKSIDKTVKNDPTALVRSATGLIELRLVNRDSSGRCKNIQEVRKLIEETEKSLDALPGVIPAVHAAFYKVSSVFLREVGEHASYYREALRYLGCESEHKLTPRERTEQAICLGFAAMLGENVYNFGELLCHPILQALQGTPESWLIDVLYAFNSGDLIRFRSHEKYWSTWEDLRKNQRQLENKIRLLSIVELAVTRPQRSITFDEIVNRAQIDKMEVELLVMKALSRGLVRGAIDQVNETVHINWIQPRVLESKQIVEMSHRIGRWAGDVERMEVVGRQNAKEILTKFDAQ